MKKENIQFLEKRVQYLEEINRFTLDALEMAASLSDFQSSINKLQDAGIILEETRVRIQRLIYFQTTAFFLVDDESNDFCLIGVEPQEDRSRIQKGIDFFIDNGTFAWALREKRPVIVSSEDYHHRFILHVMATSSRIRGMFVGIMKNGKTDIPDISLSMLSIILLNSSNALESNELYTMIREISENLQKKENYKLLFEAAPDGVEVLDARGNIVDCNKAQEIMLGRDHNKIVGNHAGSIFSERYKYVFDSNFSTLKEVGYSEGEVELVCGDGSIVPVWRKEKAIYNEKGEFVGAVIYNQDLTVRKRADEEKKKLESKLQRAQKMEALGALAGGVAHDLNNVLCGLVSYPELLLMQLPEQSPLRGPVTTIQESGKKAAAIVDDLLTLARRGVAQSTVVNFNKIVLDQLMTPEYEKLLYFHPNVEIKTQVGENLLNILGSPVHLSKTFMNLLSNAVESMPGGGTVVVTTDNRYIDRPVRGYEDVREGDYVTLIVSDTGVGISSEDIHRIFEPFYTKKMMGRSGTGLGMAVVWGTVKDHKGYIDVQSAVGQGTSVTLYFPATREKACEDNARVPRETYMGAGETILVVDDVVEQRELAYAMLTRLGYTVTTVPSGEAAVDYLNRRSVDLVILDMIMDPGIDGLDTYRRIIALLPGQKAILVSGFSESKRVTEAQKLGAGAYIKKPYLMEKIGIAIRNELSRR